MSVEPNGTVHPVADLFPMMTDEELADLAADIKANGLLYPIVLDADGQLIDGRNRLRACQIANVEPTFTSLNGHEPVAYILASNMSRRQMTQGQKAMTLARTRGFSKTSQRQLSGNYGISHGMLSYAVLVQQYAPELGDAVLAGAISLNEAYEKARSRKAERDGAAEQAHLQQQRLDDLRRSASDLADLVVEGTLTLEGAQAELRERQKREETERWAISKGVAELMQGIEAIAGTPAVREHTLRYFDATKARERGVLPSRASLSAASQWLQRLAEEWPA